MGLGRLIKRIPKGLKGVISSGQLEIELIVHVWLERNRLLTEDEDSASRSGDLHKDPGDHQQQTID